MGTFLIMKSLGYTVIRIDRGQSIYSIRTALYQTAFMVPSGDMVKEGKR